ncbi:MAG: hypothetical protein KGJ62_01395 [Armatimonadetes bacterium]|nr:hypothetical protein [Armatimonadota bacterium]MDE2205840.1 hypothetical protein [Armatimonadota bacterium]
MSMSDEMIAFGTAALAAAASAIMLFSASGGYHPYSFYEWMRLLVLISSGCSAWVLLRYAPRLAPAGIALAAFGLFLVFAKMRRAEWPPFDVCGAVAFLVAAFYAGCRALGVAPDPAP